MRLKEAQLLGILTLMAVGIVLLCMWGSDESVDQAAAPDGVGEMAAGSDWAGPDTEALLDELISEESPDADDSIAPEMTRVLVGGPSPVDVAVLSESSLRDRLDRTPAQDIKFMPREELRQADPPASPAAPVVPAAPVATRPRVHVVARGETLGEISQKYYGTSRRWREILKANDGLDPRRMSVGAKLTIPALSANALTAPAAPERRALVTSEPSAPVRTYTVKRGDTLYDLARKFYQDGTRWKDIHAANRGRLPDSGSIRPGMELIIP